MPHSPLSAARQLVKDTGSLLRVYTQKIYLNGK